MIRNLKEIKGEQDSLREKATKIYMESGESILNLSKTSKIPYTTLRAFLHGDNISYHNIFKIKKWIENIG